MKSLWPEPRTVATFFGGTIALVGTVNGKHFRFLQSGIPHVAVVHTPGGFVAFCRECETQEPMPDSPTSMGLNGAKEPLFVPGTRAHAMFALTWMNRFIGDHEHKEEEDGEESVRLQGR